MFVIEPASVGSPILVHCVINFLNVTLLPNSLAPDFTAPPTALAPLAIAPPTFLSASNGPSAR